MFLKLTAQIKQGEKEGFNLKKKHSKVDDPISLRMFVTTLE